MKATREQADWLSRRIAGDIPRYMKIRQRMEKRGFKPGDPEWEWINDIIEALQRSRILAHYGACGKP